MTYAICYYVIQVKWQFLQTTAREYQYESSLQTESKKGYSFIYPSLCLLYSDNKRRAMVS